MAIKFLSTVAVDTNVLYVDAAANKVGIGTTSPAVKLDFGSATGKAFHLHTSGTDYYGFNMLQYDTSPQGGPFSTNIFSGNGGDIKLRTASGTSIQSTRLTVKAGGNVGIGTHNPGQKLEVALGTSSGSDGIFVKGEFAGGTAFTASKNPFISLGTSTDSAYTSTIYLGSSATPTDQESKIEFNRSASSVSRLSIYHKGQGTYREHLRFGNPSSSTATSVFFGNVGIGATSPSSKLEVISNDNVGTTKIISAYSLSESQSTSLGYNSVIGSYSLALQTLQTQPITFKPNSVEAMRITSTGNVGIGTTSPGAKLDVSNAGLAAKFVSTQNTGLEVQGGANSQDIAKFKNTGGNVQFVINNGGYVGIGAASPSEKLEVAGNILANATNVAINIGSTISSTPGGGHPNTGAGTLIVGGKTNAGYNYQPGVITLINQNPNIGAGADTGVIQFAGKDDATSGYVSANIKAFTAVAAGTGNSGGGIITLGTSSGYGGPVERFRINQNGNVGIGTTSPGQKLEVDGEVLSDGYRVSAMQTAPAARNSTGTLGEIRITSNYIYVCYATNSWSRVALATSW